MSSPILRSVRPLVRYVDEEQAIIDFFLHASPAPAEPLADRDDTAAAPLFAEVQVEIDGSDGFHDEATRHLALKPGGNTVRFDLVEPERWWPAGMGEQPLYQLTVTVLFEDGLMEQRSLDIGLTSIRTDVPGSGEGHLLVNGQLWPLKSVVPVDAISAQQLLPATGDSLLLVRDHYGPDLLYEAADRAGILMIQCVPVHPDASPEADVEQQIERLAGHPSLAGWFVGNQGKLSRRLAEQIRLIDPTHAVFHELPMPDAA